MLEQVSSARVPGTGKSGGYNPAYFQRLAAIERKHFWFQSRSRVVATVVEQLASRLPADYRVLEVGCGTGNLLRSLKQACVRGMVIGMDLFYEGLTLARRNAGCPLVQGDIRRNPFLASFDIVGAFDVIEHVADDLGVLQQLHAMLKPGGTLLLTVPAHAWLWSYFDEASHHCRRYEIGELRDKLQAGGYQTLYVSEFMASILPVVWVGRCLAGRRHSGGGSNARASAYELANRELRIVPLLNGLLRSALSLEVPLIAHRRRLPFGCSIIAIAQKPL